MILQNLHTHSVYADGKDTVAEMARAAFEAGFDSLGFQSLDGLLEAIGLDRDKVCTYCWTGKE